MEEPPDDPPDDPEAWSHEQWIEWLNATRPDPEDEPIVRRIHRTRGSGAAVIGAGMLGLEQAMFGPVDEPDIVIVADADGHDDDDEIRVDFVAGDPHATSIELGDRPE